ncbi:MAG: Glucose-1-phosphate thymidylyltransferase [Acidobacteria bacterium]|nr:Glucose-1-phosphate thymidylyltransferase [Acidobacteriota bacterium]
MNRAEKAVILARGLGTRMRKEDATATLDREQMDAANAGIKAMIRIGRPFLDYILSGLADAGYTEACLVIGPEHQVVRDYYRDQPPRRIGIRFSVQQKPLGTADAVLAARETIGDELFLVVNSDNYYPVAALTGLRELGQSGVALFDRNRLVAESNIPEERVQKFAVAKVSPEGHLEHIYEKPFEETIRALGANVFVSMNCWMFSPAIFRACLSITPSARGELELTDAVQYAMDALDEKFKVLTYRSPVLDLSSRSDVAAVADKLRGIHPVP